jgi:formylglycine-generating enzyme required for sulfatase activity
LALSALGGVAYLAFRKESPADAPAVMTSSAPSSASVRVAVSAPEPSMIRVDPGTFEMGSDKGAASELPVHNVTVSRPFFIDRTEVTVDDYLRCVRAGACSSPGLHGPGTSAEALAKLGPLCNAFDPTRGRHPINCVDRMQAEKFCKFVDKRLPTEAEWEYAARGESKADYPWGNAHPDCERVAIERMEGGLCRASKSTTEAVGSFPSNASLLGVLDLAGNVREWVADGYDERAYGRGDTTDPEVRLTIVRKAIARGGAWNSSLGEAASWHRSALDRSLGDLSTGFRCARSIK